MWVWKRSELGEEDKVTRFDKEFGARLIVLLSSTKLSWHCTDIRYNLSKIVMLEFSLKLKGSVCCDCKVLELWGVREPFKNVLAEFVR